MQGTKGKRASPVTPPADEEQTEPEAPRDETLETKREGRRFAVSQRRGKGRSRLRYIETSDPSRGCRFL